MGVPAHLGQGVRQSVPPMTVQVALSCRGPTQAHFQAVRLDEVQRLQQTVQSAEDAERPLGEVEVGRIPPVRAHGAIHLAMKSEDGEHAVSGVEGGSPLEVAASRLLGESGTDVHQAAERLRLQRAEHLHDAGGLLEELGLAGAGSGGRGLLAKGLSGGEQDAHGAANLHQG